MNAQEAFAIAHPEEALRIRRKELQRLREELALAVTTFHNEAETWLVRKRNAQKRLDAVNADIDFMESL